jgi:integrase
MASIRKLTYTTPGGKRRVKYSYSIQIAPDKQERRFFEDEQTAIAELAQRQREISEGRSDRIVLLSLTEAVEKYIPFAEGRGVRTAKAQAATLRKRIVPWFGATTQVNQIGAESIRRWEQHLVSENLDKEDGEKLDEDTGRTRAAATVNRNLALLRRLLRLCKRWGHLRDVPTFEMLREPPGRLRFLTHEEGAKLVEVCRSKERYRNKHLWAVVTFALHTGCRRGEILSLTWEQVDFARGVIVLERTKSGRAREVPMSETCYAVLSELRQAQTKDSVPPTGCVFPNKKTGKALKEVTNGWQSAVKEAGLVNFKFHDLRHTAASWLVQSGASLQEVKEILGHRDLTMTLRYAHLSPGHLRTAIGRLDSVLRVTPSGDANRNPAAIAEAEVTAVRK